MHGQERVLVDRRIRLGVPRLTRHAVRWCRNCPLPGYHWCRAGCGCRCIHRFGILARACRLAFHRQRDHLLEHNHRRHHRQVSAHAVTRECNALLRRLVADHVRLHGHGLPAQPRRQVEPIGAVAAGQRTMTGLHRRDLSTGHGRRRRGIRHQAGDHDRALGDGRSREQRTQGNEGEDFHGASFGLGIAGIPPAASCCCHPMTPDPVGLAQIAWNGHCRDHRLADSHVRARAHTGRPLPMTEPQPRPLPGLLDDAGIAATRPGDVAIRRIVTDSRAVEPGSLFVAIPGTRHDGRTFIADALRNGAAAIVTEGDIPGAPGTLGVPVIRVPDARTATAHLAAAWYGHPARAMHLVGITGTVGKTSVLSIAEAVLHASGVRIASIGSLGLRIGAETIEESSYTVPEPLLLHRWLRHAADAGCSVVLMEVTSHALVQQRVAGLRYAAGAFTNLVPLEHAEFHSSFRSYVESKARFFEYLGPDAPLAFNAEDRAVRRLVNERAVRSIPCGAARTAAMRIEDVRVAPDGTRVVLNACRPIP